LILLGLTGLNGLRSLSNLIYHFWHNTVLMVYKGWIEDHKRTSIEDIINFTNGLVLKGIENFISKK